ncbi:MAG: hypothetical protein SGJ27_17795 [Candidatus Melainabacteria bacterium]|nr:hypothetical protein [Candidatus Melainabacteria bacterium]
MTTSTTKQLIKQDWDLQKVRESATKMAALQIVNRLDFMEKNHEKKEHGKELFAMEEHAAEKKAEVMKKAGVKSPLDLVRHIAEYEANMFGAKTSIEGDDSKATLFNEKPTVWLEAKKIAKMTDKQEEKMQHHYKEWMEHLAASFEFKTHTELSTDSWKITFSRK